MLGWLPAKESLRFQQEGIVIVHLSSCVRRMDLLILLQDHQVCQTFPRTIDQGRSCLRCSKIPKFHHQIFTNPSVLVE